MRRVPPVPGDGGGGNRHHLRVGSPSKEGRSSVESGAGARPATSWRALPSLLLVEYRRFALSVRSEFSAGVNEQAGGRSSRPRPGATLLVAAVIAVQLFFLLRGGDADRDQVGGGGGGRRALAPRPSLRGSSARPDGPAPRSCDDRRHRSDPYCSLSRVHARYLSAYESRIGPRLGKFARPVPSVTFDFDVDRSLDVEVKEAKPMEILRGVSQVAGVTNEQGGRMRKKAQQPSPPATKGRAVSLSQEEIKKVMAAQEKKEKKEPAVGALSQEEIKKVTAVQEKKKKREPSEETAQAPKEKSEASLKTNKKRETSEEAVQAPKEKGEASLKTKKEREPAEEAAQATKAKGEASLKTKKEREPPEEAAKVPKEKGEASLEKKKKRDPTEEAAQRQKEKGGASSEKKKKREPAEELARAQKEKGGVSLEKT